MLSSIWNIDIGIVGIRKCTPKDEAVDTVKVKGLSCVGES